MYQLNPLEQNVLITTSEVIFHAPTKHTLDPRTIQQSIIIAEERFIRPLLGDELYELMAGQKNVMVTDANRVDLQTKVPSGVILKNGDLVNAYELLPAESLKLWKQGNLWKLCAESILIISYPDQFIQFTTEGVVHPNPTASVMSQAGVVTPDLRSVKWVMDKKLMDRIDPLQQSVRNFICRYKTDYPKYTWCPCEDDNEKENTGSRKSNWATGIYDDIEPCGCDGW